MSDDQLMDVRVPLAAAEGVVVEVGRGDIIHVELSQVSLRLSRTDCERITSAMARAMVRLRKMDERRQPQLRLVGNAGNAVDDGAE